MIEIILNHRERINCENFNATTCRIKTIVEMRLSDYANINNSKVMKYSL